MMIVNHFDNMGIFQVQGRQFLGNSEGFHGGGLNIPMTGRVPTAISTNRKAHAPRPCFFVFNDQGNELPWYVASWEMPKKCV